MRKHKGPRTDSERQSQELLDFYRQHGLATDHIARSASQPTGTALIQVERASGQNSIVVVAGANGDFTPDEMADVPLEAGEDVRQWLPSDGLEGDEPCTVADLGDPVLQRLLRARSARRRLSASGGSPARPRAC